MTKKLHILSLSSLLPIKGLKRENDVILRLYYEMAKVIPINVTFFKSINYVPFPLKFISKKSLIIYRLRRREKVLAENYQYVINLFSWFAWKNNLHLKRLLSRINYWLFANKINQFIRENSIDIIHAHTFSPDAYIAYRLKEKYGIEYVLTMRMKPDDRLEMYPQLLRIVENAKAVICHNYQLYKLYSEKYNVQFMPHGLSHEFFNNKPKRESSTIFNKRRPFKLLTVARLLGLKNIDVIIEVVRRMREQGKSINYIIIGEGPEKNKLERLIQQHDMTDSIHMVTWQNENDLIGYYDDADAFIMMSKPETFGRVYLEAAARNLPIIACKNTGIDGYFSDDEALFLDDNIEAIFKNLLHLYESFEEVMIPLSKAAFRKAESLTWDNIVRQYINIYKD